MKDFILSNLPTIIILAAFLIYVIILIVNKRWDKLRADAYELMLLAETNIVGTKQGQNRFNEVFIQLYSLLPAWFRLFVPPDTLKEKLQKWYNRIKDYMDNGKVDGSIQNIIVPVTATNDINAATSTQAIKQVAATSEAAPATTAQ